jgi:chaperone required for assembly of F1-ATPase
MLRVVDVAGVDGLTATAKSLITALSVFYRHTSVNTAVTASRLEEDFQIAEYVHDECA